MNVLQLEAFPKILWLVGQQCAGKTMISRVLNSCGAEVLNIGERLRADNDVRTFLSSENPYAPSFVEERVQSMIKTAIHNVKRDNGTLVIDSAPRNVHQLPFLAAVAEISTVVLVLEDYEVRRFRARGKYGNDLSLFEKREAFEVEWMKSFVPRLVEYSIDHMVLSGGRIKVGKEAE